MFIHEQMKDSFDDGRLAFVDFITSFFGLSGRNINVAIRGAGEHADFALLRLVEFAAAMALNYLFTFVLGNDALNLQEQLIFRRSRNLTIDEDDFD